MSSTRKLFDRFHEEMVELATKTRNSRVGHFTSSSGSVIFGKIECHYILDDHLKIFFVQSGEQLAETPDLEFAPNGSCWGRTRAVDNIFWTTKGLSELCHNWTRKLAHAPAPAAVLPAVHQAAEIVVQPANFQAPVS